MENLLDGVKGERARPPGAPTFPGPQSHSVSKPEHFPGKIGQLVYVPELPPNFLPRDEEMKGIKRTGYFWEQEESPASPTKSASRAWAGSASRSWRRLWRGSTFSFKIVAARGAKLDTLLIFRSTVRAKRHF